MQNWCVVFCSCMLIFFIGFSQAFAQHQGISFQAMIKKPDGVFPNVSGVSVTAQILDPTSYCVLREEEHAGKDITKGYLNLVLGGLGASTPAGRNPSPVLSISEVMDNKKTRTNLKCVDPLNNIVSTGQSYSPATTDRRILRIRVNLEGEDIVADFNMRTVPYAVNSEMLNSKTDTDFINVNGAKGVAQANLESIFERFTKLDAILNSFNGGGTSAGINISGNAATATNVSGTVAIANGGTGATNAAGVRSNLGLGPLATLAPTGTADATTFLRGDGAWVTVSSGGAVTSVAGRTGVVTLSSSDVSGLGSLATKSSIDLSGAEATGIIDSARLPASVKQWSGAVGGINYAGGNVGIGTGTPAATLDVNGSIKVGTSMAVCDSATEGQLKYDYGLRTMQFCNGYLWVTISSPDVQTFAASGTWTKPSGLAATAVTKIRCWGGGGGGGGASSVGSGLSGGGGGGGGYNEVFLSTSTLPATQAIVVGNGGTAGSAAGGAGGLGGNSTFGAFLTAYGGGGGGGHATGASFAGTGGGGGGTTSAGLSGITGGGNGSAGGDGGTDGGGRGGGNGAIGLACNNGVTSFGGGGGGNSEPGCNAVFGGGGGAGGTEGGSGVLHLGGTSTYGGSGGTTGTYTSAATAGNVPGGGGGSGFGHTDIGGRAGGAGGKGMCLVTTYR